MKPSDFPQYPASDGGWGPQSIAGAERVVFHVLKTGLDVLAAKPEIVDRAFRLLPAAERAKIKTLLVKRKPKVVHGFPKADAYMPAVCVLLTNESEEQRYINDYLGNSTEDPELDTDKDGEVEAEEVEFVGGVEEQRVEGVRTKMTLDVWIVDLHPDTVLAYYTLLWALLDGARRRVFAPLDMHPSDLSGGDVAPDPAYMPQASFIRRLGMSLSGMRTTAFDDEVWGPIIVQVQAIPLTDLTAD